MSKDKHKGVARRLALLQAVANGAHTIGAKYCPPLTKEMRRLMQSGHLTLRRVRGFGKKHFRRNRLDLTEKGRYLVANDQQATEFYYLKTVAETNWREVTRKEWIEAERGAGFRPKLPSTDPRYMTTCATGGFSGNGIQGKIGRE